MDANSHKRNHTKYYHHSPEENRVKGFPSSKRVTNNTVWAISWFWFSRPCMAETNTGGHRERCQVDFSHC